MEESQQNEMPGGSNKAEGRNALEDQKAKKARKIKKRGGLKGKVGGVVH